jgi:hypothetical protein
MRLGRKIRSARNPPNQNQGVLMMGRSTVRSKPTIRPNPKINMECLF